MGRGLGDRQRRARGNSLQRPKVAIGPHKISHGAVLPDGVRRREARHVDGRVDGAAGADLLPERSQRGGTGPPHEVRGTSAVRGAEAIERCGSARQRAERLGPKAFAASGVVGVPGAGAPAGWAQVVDVPVRRSGPSPVPADPRLHPTRSEGAAHVRVRSRPDLHPAERANRHGLRPRHVEPQHVRSSSASQRRHRAMRWVGSTRIARPLGALPIPCPLALAHLVEGPVRRCATRTWGRS